MPDIFHLSQAPIIEAIVHFQANASAQWKPSELRQKFSSLWPDRPSIQELQPVQVKIVAKAGLPPEQSISFPGVQSLIFRSAALQTVYHVRPDGFAFSWLKPYSDWETFQKQALAAWRDYAQVLDAAELHKVAVRFINRLEFFRADFELSRFFTTPPRLPPGLQWTFQNFVQQAVYAVPRSDCSVHATLAQAFDTTPELLSFILDIEVRLDEPLSTSCRSLHDVLAEMRNLKNEAFFRALTREALSRYV